MTVGIISRSISTKVWDLSGIKLPTAGSAIRHAFVVRHVTNCATQPDTVSDKMIYHIPITDTTLELSVFWPSDTESRINEMRFSESISLSFKTRLTSVTCFCGDVT